jgi:L,D-transpeptidase YbiS
MKIQHQDILSLYNKLSNHFIRLIRRPGRILYVFIVVLAVSVLLYAIPFLQGYSAAISRSSSLDTGGVVVDLAEKQKEVEKELSVLKKKIDSYTGNSPYLVINTTENSFRLYSRGALAREGKCSTGSYVLLRNGEDQKWLFETPRGVFRIQSMTTSPVWKKPDWAFVEEGLPVPPADDASRFEYGVLGDYALGLGDGYLIHGTLYQRLLGLPVTHGCIRMNDDDLEKVFRAMNIGSKVYIY